MSDRGPDEKIRRDFMPEGERRMLELLERLTDRVTSNEEETRRKMDFVLEQQSQLTATVGRLSEKVDRTADGITSLLTIAEIHEREITVVSETQTRTDVRLNALINTVERFISEGRNGK